MKAVLHAIGRPPDVLPFVALGARVHEVESAAEARKALAALAHDANTVIILSEEFAPAAQEAPDRLVIVSPGAKASARTALEVTRDLVSRSVGVDLIAKAKRTVRRDASVNR